MKVKKDLSTFFPDSWSREKIQQEIAHAMTNMEYRKGNIYEGTASDGTKIRIHIEDGQVTSAYSSIGK